MEEAPAARDDIESFLRERRNWGRWGDDDQIGAVNLITAAKRLEAAALVRSGRTLSLSRDIPTGPGTGGTSAAEIALSRVTKTEDLGAVIDRFSVSYHGYAYTHVDALCHVWNEAGQWNGRNPDETVRPGEASWAGIQHWREGIVTRGVLLDVPRFRGEPFVTVERPVQDWELRAIAARQKVVLRPGDAVILYCGRERWDAAQPTPWGTAGDRPGIHPSCLRFIRETDCAAVLWDMLDASPNDAGLPWSIHCAIFAFGIAVIDNAQLGPLATLCDAENRYEFMLTVAPLPVIGGTGSLVNPLAIF